MSLTLPPLPVPIAASVVAALAVVAVPTVGHTTVDLPDHVRATSTQEAAPLGTVVINQPGLYPESVAYDAATDRFIVGSLVAGQLFTVDTNGMLLPLGRGPGGNLTGVEIDAARDRVLVGVASLAGDGSGAVSVHDLALGAQTGMIDLAPIANPGRLFVNDIAIADSGAAYVTNAADANIFRIGPDGVAEVFLTHPLLAPVPGGVNTGVNGIVHVDGNLIAGHGATGQIFRIPIDAPGSIEEIDTGLTGMIIDGMHLSADGSRLAVVSNTGQIVVLETDDGWHSAHEVERLATGPEFPTAVTERHGTFHVLQAHLDKLPDPTVSSFEIVPVPHGERAATPSKPTMSTSKTSRSFSTHLFGRSQVPSVSTPGVGWSTWRVDGDTMHFRLVISRTEGNIVGVHLHQAQAGRNGPVVAPLDISSSTTLDGGSAQVITGSVRPGDFAADLEGRSMAALIGAIEFDSIYVNVHTDAHPAGEIRGQLS